MLCIEIFGKKLFFKINFYETTLTMTMCSGPICTLEQVNTAYLILLLTALHTTLPQQQPQYYKTRFISKCAVSMCVPGTFTFELLVVVPNNTDEDVNSMNQPCHPLLWSLCGILGSCSVAKHSGLLGCYAMSLGKDFPTFQRIIMPLYSGFQAVCAEGIQCLHVLGLKLSPA